MANEELQNL